MRTILALLIFALAAPVSAQVWTQYDNARFGYSLVIPENFTGYGESANGDGQNFDNPATMQSVTVWGSNLMVDSFKEEAETRMGYAQGEGWNLDFQVVTPRWAGFSGVMGGQRFYRHMILLCDGSSTASFNVVYQKPDVPKMQPVIDQMVSSFRSTRC